MSETRRELLVNIGALSLTAFGVDVVSAQTARHVHAAVDEEKKAAPNVYKPKLFTASEYKTLQRLVDLIIPADEKSPGALAAGAPEFIDFLASRSSELAAIYSGGIAWLDHEMNRRYSSGFVAA